MQAINKSVEILAISGSRTIKDKNRIYFEIDEFRKTHPNVKTITTGDCYYGPDRFSKEYAQDQGLSYKPFPANWSDMSDPCVRKMGKNGFYNALAGFKRNQDIVDFAHAGLSFWDGTSRGTKDFIERSKKKGLPLKEIKM